MGASTGMSFDSSGAGSFFSSVSLISGVGSFSASGGVWVGAVWGADFVISLSLSKCFKILHSIEFSAIVNKFGKYNNLIRSLKEM